MTPATLRGVPGASAMDRSQIIEALLREVGPRGLRIARRLVGNDAEDAVQEALLRTSDARDLRDPTGWFIRVLVNHCLGIQRRRRLLRLLPFTATDDGEPEPAAEARLDTMRAGARLRRRVARLPPMQRTVIHLRYGEDLSIAEVAAATGIGEASVKTHLQRALERLRREVSKEEP